MQFKFRSEISIPKDRLPRLAHNKPIFLTGSCFSKNIGDRLKSAKFKVLFNPFGISYNPVSIAEELSRMADETLFRPEEFFEKKGYYYHFGLHSSVSGDNPEQLAKSLNNQMTVSSTFLRQSSVSIITLGTAWIYEHLQAKKIVNNCHKLPTSNFVKRLLSREEIGDALNKIVSAIRSLNPDTDIIFTISPVRHLRDGFEENSLSKAALRLAVDQIVKESRCHYFPAFEILMDDLRDYRFYESDLLHPNAFALDYVWEKLAAATMSEETMKINGSIDAVQKAITHRPFHPGSADHIQFIMATKKKVLQLMQDFSIDLSDELKTLESQLASE